MKRVHRFISNAGNFAVASLFLLLPLVFIVAPKPAAAVVSYWLGVEAEIPFWTSGGAVFLGGFAIWIAGILLAAGGGTLLVNLFVQGLSQKPEQAHPDEELKPPVAAQAAMQPSLKLLQPASNRQARPPSFWIDEGLATLDPPMAGDEAALPVEQPSRNPYSGTPPALGEVRSTGPAGRTGHA